jgi:hypothetical protein
MVEIERESGQGVRIGPYTLRVLEVRPGEVLVALLGPGEEEPPGEPPDRQDTPAGRARQPEAAPAG